MEEAIKEIEHDAKEVEDHCEKINCEEVKNTCFSFVKLCWHVISLGCIFKKN